MLHGRKEVLVVSNIMFILHPDALSLNGSVVINHQSSSIITPARAAAPDVHPSSFLSV
jgi:hypothetical protein